MQADSSEEEGRGTPERKCLGVTGHQSGEAPLLDGLLQQGRQPWQQLHSRPNAKHWGLFVLPTQGSRAGPGQGCSYAYLRRAAPVRGLRHLLAAHAGSVLTPAT